MSLDNQGGDEAYQSNEQVANKEAQLPTGPFIGRDEEQERFREMLREMLGPKRGFLGNLLGNSPKRARVEQNIKSRVIIISGPAGMGKTRLSLRLRDISQKEKEFVRRLRTTRLDWNEVRDRDQRLASLIPGQPVPPEAFLDMLYNHFVREDLGGHFEDYRQALEETRPLVLKVSGAELEAVWEYRARAIGKSLKSLSGERPLLFFQDNYERVASADHLIRTAMEESGSTVAWVITGLEEMPDYAQLVAAERFSRMPLAILSQEELLRFLTSELSRYSENSPTKGQSGEQESQEESGPIAYRSPEQIGRLHSIAGGLPLAARIAAFLLQTGISVENLPLPGENPLQTLVTEFLDGPLDTGHPDRLKLYALALLRRPERGLLTALLDLRQDLLPLNEMLGLLQTRYAFLFEPQRDMVLHTAIEGPMRDWLLQPQRRNEEQGLGRLNRRAMGFLNERLENWAQNFPTLAGRVREVKWREWALDKVWHAFWLGQEEGWREALPLFVATLAYKPATTSEIIQIIQWFNHKGVLDETSRKRLHWLEQISSGGPERTSALTEIEAFEAEQNIFRQKMPRFAAELNSIISQQA